ncbi:hypothetical protein [Streptomyces sp. AM 2-1-1]|uniref:hypothetical protein n=1 Tax=Streptomyces sp. AM 2-1-1 TaxID=3028709 RepID=UPI0023B94740|nr:hypothetical protein [Streptomyces sp. AM 2-1-1]WEH40581.1 hypothetical protein PZB77_14290 [Streptomyces sp. AM 2-1-1]
MTTPNAPWFESLAASVATLTAAAREAQAACRAAETAAEQYAAGRLRTLPGTVTVTGTHPYPTNLHTRILDGIHRSHTAHLATMRELFEETAKVYAYSVADALHAVLDGEQPTTATYTLDTTGRFTAPHGVGPVPPGVGNALDGWPDADRFERARQAFERSVTARRTLRTGDINGLAETGELLTLWDDDHAHPDRATAYGQIAVAALCFVCFRATANRL